MVVFENDVRSERKAGDLIQGDIVQCGTWRQKLTKVIAHERDTEAGPTWCSGMLCQQQSCGLRSIMLQVYIVSLVKSSLMLACAYRCGVAGVLELNLFDVCNQDETPFVSPFVSKLLRI